MMIWLKRWSWLLLVLLVAGMPAHAQDGAVLDLALEDLSGKPVKLRELTGKVVLVNFWATWCPPCIEEIPVLSAAHKDYAEQGFMVVGVNYMDKADVPYITRFADMHEISYPLWRGGPRETMLFARGLGGVFGLPTSMLLNRQGKVIYSHTGIVTRKQLDKLLATALKDKGV